MPRGPAIVLVRPRNPNNIGAAARAMANFALADLRLVEPHPPILREAKSAVGAEGLLRRARVYTSLEDALSDRTKVVATSSLKGRRPSLAVVDLPGLRLGPGAAVLFGPEKTGLTQAELGICDAIVRIPTSEDCPSMNLAQAVAVVCYHLSGALLAKSVRGEGELASFAQIERLVNEAERAFKAIGYRPDLSPEARQSRVRRLLRRRGVRGDEAGMLFELARRAVSSRG